MSRVRTPESKAEQAARFRDAVRAMLRTGELACADAEELMPMLVAGRAARARRR